MTPDELNLVVLVVCGVVLAGVVAVRISSRSGMPGLLLYLAIGLIIGEAGFGVQFEDGQLAYTLAVIAVAVLLTDGGFTTRWSDLRPVVGRAGLLATLGVVLSVAVAGGLAYLVLDLDLRTALLLAAMVSSTDAAAVFAILRRLPVRRRVRTVLEGESGFNDAPTIIIVTVVASDAWTSQSVLGMVGTGVYQLVVGALVGLAVARLGEVLLTRVSLPSSGLYPLSVLAISMSAFALSGVLGASGLLASYAAGLWLGNRALPHQGTTEGFTESLGWLAQIALFVMLGLLASPSQLPAAVVPALVIGSALTFVARPLSVAACLLPFRVPWREQAFTSWAGLRGAVPIMLATIPLTEGLPGALHMFHVTFLLVVTFTLIQAPALPALARWARVTEPIAQHEVVFDSSPLERVDAALVRLVVPRHSRLAGVPVADLRLPHGAVVTMIIRDGDVRVPGRGDRLLEADEVLLAVHRQAVAATQHRLEEVHEAGALAGWLLAGRRHRKRRTRWPGAPTLGPPEERNRDVLE